MTDIRVPASLQNTWSQVASDKSIQANEYQQLLQAAAPTGKANEVDAAERQFLGQLRDHIEANGGRGAVRSGSAAGSVTFVDEQAPPVSRQEREWAQALEQKSQQGYMPNAQEQSVYQDILLRHQLQTVHELQKLQQAPQDHKKGG
jgi:hypothetical protein